MLSEDIYVQKQRYRKTYIKIEILDTDEQNILYTLESDAVDGTYNLDSSSAIRRTCSLTFVLKDNYIPSPTSPFWINRKFKLKIGILNLKTDKIYWFNKGIYFIQNPEINISISDNNISIQGVDKMALFNGDITGSLFDNYVIQPYELTKDTIDSTTIGTYFKLNENGEYVQVNLPEDYEEGTQYYNALKVVDAIQSVVQTQLYKENVENKIKIDTSNVNINQLYVPYKIEVDRGSTKWDLISQLTDLYYNTQSYYDEDGYFCFNEKPIYDNISYPIKWDFRNDFFVQSISLRTDYSNVKNVIKVYGAMPDSGLQPCYMIEINDIKYPECLYNIQALHEGFTRDLIVQEDTYKTEEQCKKRCESEAWLHQNASDVLSFECVPIYSLDVNDVIYFENYYYNNKNNAITGRFVIDSIQCGLASNSMMSVTAHRLDDKLLDE